MTPQQVKTLIMSKNPLNGSKQYYQLMYGEDVWGGKITPDVKIEGDVYLPQGSWATGKCKLRDVKIPENTNIISLSIHSGQTIGSIGEYEMVKDMRISRGVYVSGLVRVADHENLKSKLIIGYELSIYGRKHLTIKNYKKSQKKKDKES